MKKKSRTQAKRQSAKTSARANSSNRKPAKARKSSKAKRTAATKPKRKVDAQLGKIVLKTLSERAESMPDKAVYADLEGNYLSGKQYAKKLRADRAFATGETMRFMSVIKDIGKPKSEVGITTSEQTSLAKSYVLFREKNPEGKKGFNEFLKERRTLPRVFSKPDVERVRSTVRMEHGIDVDEIDDGVWDELSHED